MEHSRIGGSGCHRWINCPGSVRLSQGIEEETSPAAAEGIAAHFLAEWVLKHELPVVDSLLVGDLEKCRPYKDKAKEMAEHVQIYVDTVRNDSSPRRGSIYIETKFSLNWLHPDMFGTNDASIRKTDPSALYQKLIIYDLKYGYNIVEPENNEQLMYYGLGALGRYNEFQVDEIELVIIQPRSPHPDGPVRRWAIPVIDLYEWGYQVLKPAAFLTDKVDSPVKSGPWCKYCRASNITCHRVTDQALALAETKTDKLNLPEVSELSDEKIRKVLDFIGLFKPWSEKVKAQATDRANMGKKIPGHKLVQASTKRRIKDTAAGDMQALYGDEVFTPQELKLKTITELEKLLGKESMESFWEKPEGAVILVPESDKRKEVKPKIKDTFTLVKTRKFVWCPQYQQQRSTELCVNCESLSYCSKL